MVYKAIEKTHCNRGHRFTVANTSWGMVRRWKIKRCKRCRAMWAKLRYQRDPEIREETKARAKKYAAKRRDDAQQLRCQDATQSP